MATTLFQAMSAIPGRVYSAFGDFVDYFSGRTSEQEASRNQNDLVDFFSEKLVSAFRAGRVRMLPYYDNLTAETPEHRLAYRWLLKEPVIKSAFMGKLLAVMSLDLQVDPASESPRDKEIAAFIEDSLRRCAGGPAEIVWSILFGALLEGNGIAEKVWGRIDRGKYRGRPTIRALKAKDSHDYQIEIDEFNNPTMVRSRRTSEDFPMSDFTFFSHMAAFSNPIGMSDLRAVYRAGWMLDTVWKLRAIGLERFTLPIFMSKYPAGRTDIRDSINDAVKKAKALGYLTVPQEAAVEAVEMASKSGSDFDAAIKGLQEECFIAIQGATLQALAGNVTEGRGDSSVHKTTSELFVWYLSVAAANVINDQYIPDVTDLNYADADYPVCWLGGVNDGDLKSALELDTGLLNLGLVQDPHDLARRYRRQLSNNPAEALATLKLIRQLGTPAQPPPGMGGGMDMGGLGGPPPGDGGGGGAGGVPGGDQQFADVNIQTAPMKQIMDEAGGRSSEQPPFIGRDGDGEWEEFEEYHGPNPPAEGKWKQTGTGPHGGKIWERVSEGTSGSALVPSPVKADHVVGDDGKHYPASAVTQDKAGNHHYLLPPGSPKTQSPVTGGYFNAGSKMPIRRSDAFKKAAAANDAKLWPGRADAQDATFKVKQDALPAPEAPKAGTPAEVGKSLVAKGKAADRLKPKPEGWGDAAIIPGNTHRGVWNIATSTGYNRAKPLIDDAVRIHALGDKATDAEVRALAEKIANTTGQDALYTLAQAAGVSGGGGAKAVAQRIVAPLKRDVGELPDNDLTKESALQKQAVKEGVPPAEARKMTAYARTMRDDANKQIDYHNDAVKFAYSILSKENGGRGFTQHHPAFNGGDYNSVKGFDTMAREVNSHYPGLFGTTDTSGAHGQQNDHDQEKLWEMLQAGPRQRQTINDTFPQVLDDWKHHQSLKKPDEAVPFAESFDSFWESYAAATWSGPNTGPHGGTYWVNSKTGRHLYQKEKPGAGQDDAGEEPLWAKDPNEPKEEVKPAAKADPLTGGFDSNAKIIYSQEMLDMFLPEHGGDEKAAMDAMKQETNRDFEKLFPGLEIDSIASLVGAPNDARVHVYPNGDGSVSAAIDHKYFTATRTVGKDKQGRLYLSNESFTLNDDVDFKTGIGLSVFSNQVKAAIEAGIDHIRCDAAGNGHRLANPNATNPYNGFYTWPRLGYDAPIASVSAPHSPELSQDFPLSEMLKMKYEIQKKFPDAETVLDIMETKEGRQWWLKNGAGAPMKFDLTEGSRSRQILGQYLAEKGKA